MAVARRIVILGGGTGGTLVANRLRRPLPVARPTITVVDQDDRHVYQPGLLFVPFGLAHPDEIVRPRGRQLHRGIDYRQTAHRPRRHRRPARCTSTDGTCLDYDVLVVATGAVLRPRRPRG